MQKLSPGGSECLVLIGHHCWFLACAEPEAAPGICLGVTSERGASLRRRSTALPASLFARGLGRGRAALLLLFTVPG